jgi:oligoendopeptidase F
MQRIEQRTLAATLIALAALAPAPAAARERSEVPEAYTWNLKELYPDEAAWEAARASLTARLPKLADQKGHLGDSPAALLGALEAVSALRLDLERLYVYAEARNDEDTRQNRPRELKQGAQRLMVDLGSATSWIRPELLALDEAKVRGFLKQEPKLAPHRVFLEETLRYKPHTLSAAEEQISAMAGDLTGASRGTYGTLKDADLPYPTVKLSTGEVRLDPSAYTLQRASPVKADRDLTFEKFFGALKTYERTFGSTLDAHFKGHLFDAKVHKFGTTLEAALFESAIPTSVYTQLVSDVRRSLPTLHRFLKLRQRMLGLPQLAYQDLYVPTVGKVDLTFTPDQARAVTLEAVAPLGKAYQDGLKKGFESRWTDFLPSTGKRPGAYSTGVYGVHPYQLLNYNGQYDDVSTLAHE